MVTNRSVGILRRQREDVEREKTAWTRLLPIADALADVGLLPEMIVYREDAATGLREQLLGFGGVLVWVDPISSGDRDRSQLDALLREVANEGVWVSAHPDVILKMATKEVLFATRNLGWGTDIDCYRSHEEFVRRFPDRLRQGAPRVLKQHRGNDGIGVWKVELVETAGSRRGQVRVQHAEHRGPETEELALDAFMTRCAPYFAASGLLVDQAFQPRVGEGLIRAYLVEDEVIGFARQTHDGEPPRDDDGQQLEPSPERVMGLPSPKTMYPPSVPRFARMKASLEGEWVAAMLGVLGMSRAELPAIWDADFLLGPPDASGADSYVLCEINASSVTPFPPEAPTRIARSVAAHLGVAEG